MPAISQNELNVLLGIAVSRLREALTPRAIYLYGSHAYGTPGPSSDIDLLVVVDDQGLTPMERDALAYRALGDIDIPIDVQVYTQQEFTDRSTLSISFERTVRLKSRLLHAA